VDIRNQTIVLTGASSGIGAQAARQLADAGAHVCLVARREEELREVQRDIESRGGKAWIYPCNLVDGDELDACAERILQEHPRIDALVNNAARSIRRPIVEALDRLHDYERTMQLNYFAAVRLTLKLLPRFIEQRAGHIVNITTMSTQIPIPLFSAYLASKSALESFTRSLVAELSHKGLSATLVYFPMVRTSMSSRTDIYKHMPMMNARKAAGWIVEAVEKRPARIASPFGNLGEVVMASVPGLATRWAQPFFRLMDKQLKQKMERE
jgi:short-subunit dehydrogenase